jgi:hypothetical protein
VEIGKGLGEASLLEEVERCYVLDVVERHFRGTMLVLVLVKKLVI